MSLRIRLAATAAIVMIAVPAFAQTADERAAARDLLNKRGDAVVTVRATVKMRGMPGPGGAEAMEDTVQANAVVLDGTGLTVTALSQLDPSDMLMRLFSGMPGAPEIKLSVDQSNIRIRLNSGQEVPAKIVLRDKDLDLIFLRPTDAPAAPMASVDMAAPGKAQAADLVMVVQRFGEITGWKAGVSFGSVQAVVERPRTMYVVAAGGGGLGSAVFDTTGKFLGIIVMRSQSTGRTGMLSMMGGSEGAGMLPVVLPVQEIAELAKQAK